MIITEMISLGEKLLFACNYVNFQSGTKSLQGVAVGVGLLKSRAFSLLYFSIGK